MLDVLIKNGKVVDGTGNPWRYADVGVADGRIACILPPGAQGLRELKAKKELNARGLVVTPGFIDVHSHADFGLLDDPVAPYYLFQGLTTVIVGNCGHSAVGGSAAQVRDYWHRQGQLTDRQLGDAREWQDLNGYRRLIASQGGLSLWAGMLMGHGTIRMCVMGAADRPATRRELDQMSVIVAQGMEQGAVGLSTGLDYQPAKYAPTDELIELARVVAGFGGIYSTHMRDARRDIFTAIDEAIRIGEQSGARVQIAHMPRAGLSPKGLNKLADARSRGIDVACDAIPYSTFFALRADHLLMAMRSGSQELFNLSLDEVRDALRSAGTRQRLRKSHILQFVKPDSSVLVRCRDASMEGRTLREAASVHNVEPLELLFELLLRAPDEFTLASRVSQSEDFAAIPAVQLQSEHILMGTDAGPVDPLDPLGWYAPQGSGSTFRYLALGERHGVPLEHRVRKLASLAAERFGLVDRGKLEPGKLADILVFDPHNLTEIADWAEPYAAPKGISHVLVGGVPTVWGGELTGDLPGGVVHLGQLGPELV